MKDYTITDEDLNNDSKGLNKDTILDNDSIIKETILSDKQDKEQRITDLNLQNLIDKIKKLEENQTFENSNYDKSAPVKNTHKQKAVNDKPKDLTNDLNASNLNLLKALVNTKKSASNNFSNFYDPAKNDENIFIAKMVFSVAFGIFIVAYLFSYLSAKSIEEQYESRKEKLADMIDINTGAYREKDVFSLNHFKEYLHRKNEILKDVKNDSIFIFNKSIAGKLPKQNNTKELNLKNIFFIKNEDKSDNKHYFIENFGFNKLNDLKLNQEKNLASKFKIFDDKQEVSFLDFAKYLEEVDESKLKRIKARLDSDNKFNLKHYVETESAQLEREKNQLKTRINFLNQNLENKNKKTDNNVVDSLLFAGKVIEFMKNNSNEIINKKINIKYEPKDKKLLISIVSNIKKSNDNTSFVLNDLFNNNNIDTIETDLLNILNSFSNNIQSPIEMIGDNEELKNIKFKEITEYNPDIAKENTYKESVLFVLYEAYQNLKIVANDDVTQKAAVVKEISDLTNQLNSLSVINVSIGKYKENKTYLFQKQFELCSDAIAFTINKAVKYMALYNALIWVILVFSIAAGGCIFVISSAGWNDVNNSLRVFTICVVAVLAVSNLILLTIKPQSNYKNYLGKADMNESNQRKIINFFNNYESLDKKDVDSMLKQNLDLMTKFTDIVPDVDESGLIKDVSKFSGK